MLGRGKEDVRRQIWIQGWEARGGQPGVGPGGKEIYGKARGHAQVGSYGSFWTTLLGPKGWQCTR